MGRPNMSQHMKRGWEILCCLDHALLHNSTTYTLELIVLLPTWASAEDIFPTTERSVGTVKFMTFAIAYSGQFGIDYTLFDR